MGIALMTFSISLVCIVVFVIYSFNEKQKNKTILIGVISQTLLELNQNKEILKLILINFKPKKTFPEVEVVTDDTQMVKRTLPIGLEPPIFKQEFTEQLKSNNDFLLYSDLNLSVELNNLLLRLKYLNKLIPDLNSLAVLSDEEYKTVYHTHEMIVKLVLGLEVVFNKLKK